MASSVPLRTRGFLAFLGLGVLAADLVLVNGGRNSWSPWRLVPPAVSLLALLLIPSGQRPVLGLRLPLSGGSKRWVVLGGGSIALLVGWWTISKLLAPHDCSDNAEISLYAGRDAFVRTRGWVLGMVGVVGEELIYRLGSLPHLVASLGPVPALATNAVAFTILHVLYYHQVTWLYPLGAILYASLFVASRSVWVVLLVHFGTNLSAHLVSLGFWWHLCH